MPLLRTVRSLMVAALLGMATLPASADELLWARRSQMGGMTTIAIGPGNQLYCTGCNINNYGRIPVQRGPTVDADIFQHMEPWMATPWVVLFTVSRGNSCAADLYTLSLNTHLLERVNTSRFQCREFDISVAERGTGMLITMADDRGRRVVAEVK